MTGWELRDPLFLLAAALAPLVYWLASRHPGTVTYSSLELVDRSPRSLRARLARLPALGLALAVVGLSIALAGPRTGDATSRVSREGIAVMMVVDHSGSMQARDFVESDLGVDRLRVVKQTFHDFVAGGSPGPGRPDDLIGLVAFARYADGLCPLTLDHGNLLAILDQLEIVRDPSEDGTALGEGLALAVERLRRHPARSRVAILLTDGVSNAGEVAPLQAADLARSFGIKVYTIGAGHTGYAPFPVQLPDGRTVLRRAWVETDEETLQAIASRTGGRFFRARDAEGLAQVVREIDGLERSKISEVRYLQYTEHYAGFVGAALLLLAFSSLASRTLLRRLP